MKNKHVKVIGGIKETREEGEGERKKTRTVFTVKREIVIAEQDLAALFRRDDFLCSLPSIKIIPTQEPRSHVHSFSDLPIA